MSVAKGDFATKAWTEKRPWVVSHQRYVEFLKTYHRTAGTSIQVIDRMSGIDINQASAVNEPATVSGKLVLRAWVSPAASSQMLVFIDANQELQSFSVWRGSGEYRSLQKAELGSKIKVTLMASGVPGRVLCREIKVLS